MIYFDNAATGWPKPPDVLKEVELTMRFRGGNPSRGGHPMAKIAGQTLYRCREKLASHFGSEPERVIFTPGATYSLNYAMKSAIGAGDHFLISNMEHNAVYRTACSLRRSGAEFDTFDALADPKMLLAEIKAKIRKNTVAIVCVQSSNVVSLTLPIGKIGALCSATGLLLIVDAAQSAGHIPLPMAEMNIDALCLPGHKGLLGPQGCGCMILSKRMTAHMERARTVVEGGTGIFSLDAEMPTQLPERYEPGTQPTPLIAGLYAGICFLEKIGYEEIRKREKDVFSILREGLLNMDFVTLYLPEQTEGNILLFNVKGVSTTEVGDYFDRMGICMRSGFHCAPLAHRRLGTSDQGALRVSIGWNNTKREALSFLSHLWNAQKGWKM